MGLSMGGKTGMTILLGDRQMFRKASCLMKLREGEKFFFSYRMKEAPELPLIGTALKSCYLKQTPSLIHNTFQLIK